MSSSEVLAALGTIITVAGGLLAKLYNQRKRRRLLEVEDESEEIAAALYQQIRAIRAELEQSERSHQAELERVTRRADELEKAVRQWAMIHNATTRRLVEIEVERDRLRAENEDLRARIAELDTDDLAKTPTDKLPAQRRGPA